MCIVLLQNKVVWPCTYFSYSTRCFNDYGDDDGVDDDDEYPNSDDDCEGDADINDHIKLFS